MEFALKCWLTSNQYFWNDFSCLRFATTWDWTRFRSHLISCSVFSDMFLLLHLTASRRFFSSSLIKQHETCAEKKGGWLCKIWRTMRLSEQSNIFASLCLRILHERMKMVWTMRAKFDGYAMLGKERLTRKLWRRTSVGSWTFVRRTFQHVMNYCSTTIT